MAGCFVSRKMEWSPDNKRKGIMGEGEGPRNSEACD